MTSEELREAALLIELRNRSELMNAERQADAEFHMKVAEAKALYAQRLAAEVTALFTDQDPKT